jgi:hypothetical protein
LTHATYSDIGKRHSTGMVERVPERVRAGFLPLPDEFAASESFLLFPSLASIALGEVGELAKVFGACEEEADDLRRVDSAGLVIDPDGPGKVEDSFTGEVLKPAVPSLSRPLPFDLGLVAIISGTSSSCMPLP